MIKKLLPVFAIFVLLVSACGQKTNNGKFEVVKGKDKNGYEYQEVQNDPTKTRLYTLKNGLQVYLSENKDEPRIQTYIAVKAGSTYDPADNTGLAHYLEHMMFKGSTKIATADWSKEGPLIQEISDLFEEHKAAKTKEEKKAIYRKIDSVSGVAAQFAIANEYDKLVSSMGAKGTNAYTSTERTVYVNDIPKNQFEKWLSLESERFSSLVLRLFHTELETVYEEFNMYQDMDRMRVYYGMQERLFPTHPYGTQTPIGKPEHLKNPSMVSVMNYFNTYYRPNNMAICLSGDLDKEETIKLIDNTFGKLEANETLPAKKEFAKEAPITEVQEFTVKGPEAEGVTIAFRLDGDYSDDKYKAMMFDMVMSNSEAGLIDLNLKQQQKVLSATCYNNFDRDYGYWVLSGEPREGQTLEEVRDLLLAEVEKVKKGEFEEWLLEAIVNDFKKSRMRLFDSRRVAHEQVDIFSKGVDWITYLETIDKLEKVTKKDIIDFANKKFNANNYVINFKRKGKDENIYKVDKPELTAVPVNRDSESAFLKDFMTKQAPEIQPEFVDFNNAITTDKMANGAEFKYVENPSNELFSLSYQFDMGKYHNIKLPLALRYLEYVGTDKYSAEDLKKEFYKIGVSFNIGAGSREASISMNGLEENLVKAGELLNHVVNNAKADKESWDKYVDGILKKRADAKLDARTILGRMRTYATYGPESPVKYLVSEEELKSTDPQELIDIVKDMINYKHRVFYYGKMSAADAKSKVEKFFPANGDLKAYPAEKEWAKLDHTENKVYFFDYDMVQAQVMMVSKDVDFDSSLLPMIQLYQNYYGSGLSSIVFQEIRESKALAYSAFAGYGMSNRKEDPFYQLTFVGTSAEKLPIATSSLMDLLNNMKFSEVQFNSATKAIMKKIETERITKQGIYYTWKANKDLGISHDKRKDVYEFMKNVDKAQFEEFFNKHIAGKNYTFVVIGNKKDIDFNVLKKIGPVTELNLEELYGY